MYIRLTFCTDVLVTATGLSLLAIIFQVDVLRTGVLSNGFCWKKLCSLGFHCIILPWIISFLLRHWVCHHLSFWALPVATIFFLASHILLKLEPWEILFHPLFCQNVFMLNWIQGNNAIFPIWWKILFPAILLSNLPDYSWTKVLLFSYLTFNILWALAYKCLVLNNC
jgi:hypothetical protein